MKILFPVFVLCAMSPFAFGQKVSIEVGGQVGLTPSVPVHDNFSGPAGYLNKTYDHPKFVAGPEIGLLIRNHVAITLSAVYVPIRATHNTTAFGNQLSEVVRAHSWELPLIGSYRFGPQPVRSYAGAGFVAWKRVTGTDTDSLRFTTLASGRETSGEGPFRVLEDENGFVLVGGLEIKIPLIYVLPEVRFTKWSANNSIPGYTHRTPSQTVVAIKLVLRRQLTK